MTALLRIGSRCFDAAALAAALELEDASPNTQAALDFCAQWLGGATSFPIETSGSTGAPKPILLTRAQMEASARATAAALGLQPGWRSLVCLPARYVAGRMMLTRGLVVGMDMTLVEPSARPLDGLENPRFDFAAFVPLQVEPLLAGPGRPLLDGMRAVLVGGAPLPAALESALREVAAPVYHTYGMTETATHVALRRLSGPQASARFRPLTGVELALDERGCLMIRGAVTDGAWIVTNDVVELAADGSFAWRGRADNVINSGGVKVQIEPLEAALEPLLEELAGEATRGRRFFVTGLPDARLGQRVALVLEGDPLPPHIEEPLLAGLRRALGPFEAPRLLRYVPRFAETPTAKIDRAATLRLL